MTLLMFTQMRFRTFANERNKQPKQKKKVFYKFLFCKKKKIRFFATFHTPQTDQKFFMKVLFGKKKVFYSLIYFGCVTKLASLGNVATEKERKKIF